jgi:hypothetical protein
MRLQALFQSFQLLRIEIAAGLQRIGFDLIEGDLQNRPGWVFRGVFVHSTEQSFQPFSEPTFFGHGVPPGFRRVVGNACGDQNGLASGAGQLPGCALAGTNRWKAQQQASRDECASSATALIPRAAQLWQREFTVSPGQTITPAVHRVRFRERLLLARPQCRLIGYRYSVRQVFLPAIGLGYNRNRPRGRGQSSASGA